jgi:hypothetical protein
MKRQPSNLLWVLLLTWLLALPAATPAQVQIVNATKLRSVSAHYTDLGDVNYPFKSLWVDQLYVNGTNSGGGSTPPVVFTNTVTLAPGSAAYCAQYAGIAGVWVLGIPAGQAGTNGLNGLNGAAGLNGTNAINILSNSVLSSLQTNLFATNAFICNGSNYVGSFPQLESFLFLPPYDGPGGATPNTNVAQNVCASLDAGVTWFILTNSPCNFTNPIQISVSGVPSLLPGALYLWGVDHPELVGRTNSFYGQHYQFDNPVLPQDAVTLNYLNSYFAATMLGPSVGLGGNWYLTSTNRQGTNWVSFTGLGLTPLALASVGIFIPIDSAAIVGTNLVLQIAVSNWTGGALLETATNIGVNVIWQPATYTTYTNAPEIFFTNAINPNVYAQFYRSRRPFVAYTFANGSFSGDGSGLTNVTTTNLVGTLLGTFNGNATVTNLTASTVKDMTGNVVGLIGNNNGRFGLGDLTTKGNGLFLTNGASGLGVYNGVYTTPSIILDDASGNTKIAGVLGLSALTTAVASASTISPPTGINFSIQIFHISGTTQINTINLPYTGFTGTICLIPDAAFTTGTSGNIALASTAVIKRALYLTYDGSKWYPSY